MQKYLAFISITLLVILIVCLFFYPEASGTLSLTLLIFSLGMALFFTVQKYIGPYKQGEITRLKFTRNVLFDTLGLLLTIAAASYLGGMAGTRLGGSFGLWARLIAGIASAFVAAWSVRKLWAKAIVLLMG